jgi:predicted RNA-binding Zn-ribbon protein involved in translation (DUF1610 family)
MRKMNPHWRSSRCSTHSPVCKKCFAIPDHNIGVDESVGLCSMCIQDEDIEAKRLLFVCAECGSTKTIRRGNKYACFEGDPQNWRRRKQAVRNTANVHGNVF